VSTSTPSLDDSLIEAALIKAGDPIPRRLPSGSVVTLAPGPHPDGVFVEGDLEIHGTGSTLDAHGRGAVVHIAEDGISVLLTGVTLRGGNSQLGAGLFVEGASDVVLRDVVIEAGRAPGGGSGVGAIRGRLTLERCRVQGEALFTGIATVTLRDTVVTQDLLVREGARVELIGGAVEGMLDIRGTTTRKPTVTVRGAALSDIHNNPQLPGELIRAD
jgi:hypothetical protein